MDIQLRQRLLAAIVVLALIVIFVPMLFRKHAKDQISQVTIFPQAPAKPNVGQMTPAVTKLATPTTPAQPLETAQPVSQVQPSEQAQPVEQVQQVQPAMLVQPVNPPIPDEGAAQISTQQPGSSVVPVNQTIPAPKKPVSLAPKRYQSTTLNIKPIKLSQTTLNTLGENIHLRKSNVNSNNVLPEISTTQQAQLKTAQANNQAWVVQLGSFANNQNADKLVKELRSKGFTAFSYAVHQGHIVNHHVYVGPMVKKEAAKMAQKKLAEKMHLKSLLVSFNATKFH